MSEEQADKDARAEASTQARDADDAAAESAGLAELMAAQSATKQKRGGRDLEGEALLAAEAALAQGQEALAEARAHLGLPHPGRTSVWRERVLRLVLVVNLLLMGVVLLAPELPFWPVQPAPEPAPSGTSGPPPTPQPNAAPVVTEPPPPAVTNDPYLQALAAADRGNYDEAIALMDDYLAKSPRLGAARRMGVFQAQAYYAMMLGQDSRAAEFEQKAAALVQSHSLPEDLLEMARRAEERGDPEGMRRIYAKFLLQQKQIPPSLYRRVAEAYLKLGDSYRMQAQNGAEAERRRELEATREQLRAAEPPGREPGKVR